MDTLKICEFRTLSATSVTMIQSYAIGANLAYTETFHIHVRTILSMDGLKYSTHDQQMLANVTQITKETRNMNHLICTKCTKNKATRTRKGPGYYMYTRPSRERGVGWQCNHRLALPHQREMVTQRKWWPYTWKGQKRQFPVQWLVQKRSRW